MLSHYPRFREGASDGLVAKLGGLPWGLPVGLWPVCRECDRPMSHLAQLPAADAIAIGEDEVLFVFKCEWDSVCSFWEADGGANFVFTVARSSLGDDPTPVPTEAPDGPPAVLRELAIEGWRAGDDGAPTELEDAFYDYERHRVLPAEIAHPHDWASAWRTKAGGAPYWTANGVPETLPGRLLLQLDTWVDVDSEEVAIANFCSDGTAYVLVDRTRTPPAYAMIVQR